MSRTPWADLKDYSAYFWHFCPVETLLRTSICNPLAHVCFQFASKSGLPLSIWIIYVHDSRFITNLRPTKTLSWLFSLNLMPFLHVVTGLCHVQLVLICLLHKVPDTPNYILAFPLTSWHEMGKCCSTLMGLCLFLSSGESLTAFFTILSAKLLCEVFLDLLLLIAAKFII